ncbi:MAG: aspartyl/asparaginyl beta-hydroxylase domain-containing protein [Chitinophagales bacterium]
MTKAVYFLTEEDQYKGSEPYFFDKEKFPWAKTLEDNWQIIRKEMLGIIDGKESISLSSTNPPYLSSPDAWKNIYFYNFMWKYHKNCERFPETYKLLKSIPNLTFAEFTVLEPGSKILPHIGETNTTIRGHLGIEIPGKLPEMGIHVGEQERAWENGKVVLFSDAHRHYVWNNSDKRRFVLVFDVVRDEFADNKLWVCAQCLSALSIKWVDEQVSFFKKLPSFLMHAFHKIIAVLWFIYLPLQRKLKLP